MVMLNDAQTGVAIPYASVWATITKAGQVSCTTIASGR